MLTSLEVGCKYKIQRKADTYLMSYLSTGFSIEKGCKIMKIKLIR